jgi:hypothetical protein
LALNSGALDEGYVKDALGNYGETAFLQVCCVQFNVNALALYPVVVPGCCHFSPLAVHMHSSRAMWAPSAVKGHSIFQPLCCLPYEGSMMESATGANEQARYQEQQVRWVAVHTTVNKPLAIFCN